MTNYISLKNRFSDKIKRNIFLDKHTTFKIGGPAKYFLVAEDKEELLDGINWAFHKNLPFFILGGGSNLLVSDKGYQGLIIKIKSPTFALWASAGKQKSSLHQGFGGQTKIKSSSQNSKVIGCEAGVKLGDLVRLCANEGLTAMEWAAGIPGTVGGAIYGNAGAFGSSMAEVVEGVEILEVKKFIEFNKNPSRKFTIRKLNKKECRFGYRESIFKKNKDLVILSAIIRLKKGDKDMVRETTKNFLKQRAEKQPLGFPSAGSVFKNVPLTASFLKKFPETAMFKKQKIIPAAWLIEQSRLKGKTSGKVGVSLKHAGFIVNLGGAKARDVLGLIELVKRKVNDKFGVTLQEEIQYI